MPFETVAEGVRELDSDDAVVIRKTCRKTSRPKFSTNLPADERDALARASNTGELAGRRMRTEFIAVGPAGTVGQTIDYMRETPDLPERFWELRGRS